MMLLPALLAASLTATSPPATARPAVTQLTHVIDAYPMLSPDGNTLLFQSNRGGRWALYLARPDGSEPRVLLDSGDDPVSATWSPDGRRIAFAATVEGQSEIFVMDADGGRRQQLTNDPGDDAHPHWSRDGRIFFNSARTTPDRSADWTKQWHEVFSMRADGSDARQHTRCRTVCTYPVPSPDGKRIVYRKVLDAPAFDWGLNLVERNSEVFVAALDGSGEVNVSKSAAYDGWPHWSPDGEWIAFSSNRTGPAFMGQLYRVRADGAGLEQLTFAQDAAYIQASWSPSGNALYAYRAAESASAEQGSVARIDLAPPAP